MQLLLSDLSAGQRYNLLSSVVVPRPIAWITTLNEAGTVNLAPFSYFNLMGDSPPLVVIGIGQRPDGSGKDTFRNIRRSHQFVINLVTEQNAVEMNLSATDFPPGQSEVEALRLATAPSGQVAPPRLLASPVNLEARELQTLLIGENRVVIGELLVAHVQDEFINAETLRVATEKLGMIGRLQGGTGGGYARTTDRFNLERLTFEQWQARRVGAIKGAGEK